jgi:hypothetical protein
LLDSLLDPEDGIDVFLGIVGLLRLVAGFPPRRPGFEPRSGHVGFVVEKVALGQIFSFSVSPAKFSFH